MHPGDRVAETRPQRRRRIAQQGREQLRITVQQQPRTRSLDPAGGAGRDLEQRIRRQVRAPQADQPGRAQPPVARSDLQRIKKLAFATGGRRRRNQHHRRQAQGIHDHRVRRQQANLEQLARRVPRHGLPFPAVRLTAPAGDTPGVEFDLELRISVQVADQRAGGLDGDAELLVELARQRGLAGLAGVNLAAREFPGAGQALAGRALGDQHAAVGSLENGGDDVDAANRVAQLSFP
jgi:hypothetical protein